MKVKAANNLYRMSRKEFNGMLGIAQEAVPFGIYAIVKGDYAELTNLPVRSRTELKKLKRNFKEQGFKVYANANERV